MRQVKKWTAEEVALVREYYSKTGGLELLVVALGRPRASIWMKAQRLGIPHYMYLLRGAKGSKGNRFEGAAMTVNNLKQMTTEDAEGGCWNWNGGKLPFGYGKMTIDYKTVAAHRVMFKAAYPDVDITRLNVNHHCDNAACINPLHLYAGTQSENIRDCVKRGRHRWNKATA